jgi:hypothetical protein
VGFPLVLMAMQRSVPPSRARVGNGRERCLALAVKEWAVLGRGGSGPGFAMRLMPMSMSMSDVHIRCQMSNVSAQIGRCQMAMLI